VGLRADENIVGKAFFIWLNLNELGRFGSFKMRDREAASWPQPRSTRGHADGLIILLFVVMFVALLGFKLIRPTSILYRKKAINALARQGTTAAEIRRSFDLRSAIDDIKVRAATSRSPRRQ